MKDLCSENTCTLPSIQLLPTNVDSRRDYIEHVCSIMLRDRFGPGYFADAWEDDDDHRPARFVKFDLMPVKRFNAKTRRPQRKAEAGYIDCPLLRLGRFDLAHFLGRIGSFLTSRHIRGPDDIVTSLRPFAPFANFALKLPISATHARGSPGRTFHAKPQRSQRTAKKPNVGPTTLRLCDSASLRGYFSCGTHRTRSLKILGHIGLGRVGRITYRPVWDGSRRCGRSRRMPEILSALPGTAWRSLPLCVKLPRAESAKCVLIRIKRR